MPGAGGLAPVDDLVMEFEERQLRLCNQQVLVVAVVADQGAALGVARQVICKDPRDPGRSGGLA
jgi:hypothetical protein